MKTFRPIFFLLLIACSTLPCFAHHMAVVTSKQSTITTMTATVGKVFRAEAKKWPDGKDVVLVLHRASAGEAVTLQRLNKMSPKQWQTWMSEHKDAVKLVDSDQEFSPLLRLHREPSGWLTCDRLTTG